MQGGKGMKRRWIFLALAAASVGGIGGVPVAKGASPSVVISEFAPSNGDGQPHIEFVELYNASFSTVDVSGWSLKHSSADGVVSTVLTLSAGTVIPPHEHLLMGSALYAGPSPDYVYSGGGRIANDGGIAIFNAQDVQIDAVGMSAGTVYKEGTPLPEFLGSQTNHSYERAPGAFSGNGQDTDDNTQDFQRLTTSRPQNLGAAPTPEPRSLSVTTSGSGVGTVTSAPAGINCGTTCSATFPAGSPVELSAAPATGSVFTGWSGDCAGALSCHLTMDVDRTVTAVFEPVSHRPDALIKLSTDDTYIGGDVYSATAAGETRSANARRGDKRTFLLRFENDGNVVDSFAIKGARSSSNVTVKYLRGTTNVTAAVVEGTLSLTAVAPGAARTLKLVATVVPTAEFGTTKKVLVTATSQSDGATKDGIRAKVRVVR